MSTKLEADILDLLKRRGPVEISCLWHELKQGTATVITAYDMSERGLIWWLHVEGTEDHAIVGLPDQPKPEKPLEYIGLEQPITSLVTL